jgi:hydrogenase maturation protein HypF
MEFKKIRLPFKTKRPILALGAQTKNTVCFAKSGFAYLSPVHPDLSNPKDFLNFERTIKFFLKKRPKIIAYDLHPEYQSTKYALSLPATRYLLSTQHHHAHVASCMVENGLKNQKVIGVALDGTGLGTDNRLWGAEFLVCDYKNLQRIAHLREIPLLGGQKAILEPSRLALFWLYLIFKDGLFNLNLKFLKKIDKSKWQVLKNMYLSKFNSPLSSSMGRLFDAVASLVLEKYKVNFEAELAMELEKLATGYRLQATGYKFNIIKKDREYILDPAPMLKEIVSDLINKEFKESIAYRFHLTVAEMIRRMCLLLKKETGINKVILSGGVFQNNLLLTLSLDLLYKEGLQVLTHRGLSGNDSSLSLGQAAISNFKT